MITYEVRVCIGQDNPDKKVAVKCHDTGVNLMVYLVVCRHGKWMDTIEPYKVPAGSTAVIKIAKPDKTFCVLDGEIRDGGIFFEMKPQAFTSAGESHAEVSIFGPDGRRLTSSTFYIHVEPECTCESKEESENYVDVMAKQITAAVEAEKNAKDFAAEAKYAAGKAENSAVRQPYPNDETGTWWVWDAESGAYTDTGVSYGTGGGTSDHDKLTGRDKADQHPMSAITGLEDALEGKQPKGNYLTDDTLSSAIDTALTEAKESGEFDGEPGTDGKDGADGQAATFEIVSTETLEPGKDAAVTETEDSTPQARRYIVSIPQGKQGPAGVSGVYVGDGEMPDDCNVQINPNGKIVEYIPAPAAAEIGQTIVVKSVDENGRPTEWAAADMASGGGSENWRLIKTLNFSSEIAVIEFSVDDAGNEFALSEIMIRGSCPDIGTGYIYAKPASNTTNNAIWPTVSKQFVWLLAAVDSSLKTILAVSNTAIIWPADKLPACGEKITNIMVGGSVGFSGDGTLYVYGR